MPSEVFIAGFFAGLFIGLFIGVCLAAALSKKPEQKCMDRAPENKMAFELSAEDGAAPVAIRAWINERIRLGRNELDDDQIRQAMDRALAMERIQGRFQAQKKHLEGE